MSTAEVMEQYEATVLELRQRKANAEAWISHIKAHRNWLRPREIEIYQERADEAELALLVVEQMMVEL